MLLIIFGMFGWVQWFISVTKIHSVDNGTAASVLQQLLPPRSVSQARRESRQLVHQIQLKSSTVNDFHTISHASPKQNDFTRDWLGNNIKQEEDECQPMHAWQLPENTPYSCNLVHELSLDYFNIVGCGGDRCAVQIKDGAGHAVAFKTMR
jgi:hypothetical protein